MAWAGPYANHMHMPRSRQITMPKPHHSVFYRPDALPAAQPTVSKHWRQSALKAISPWINCAHYKGHWHSTTSLLIALLPARSEMNWYLVNEFTVIHGHLCAILCKKITTVLVCPPYWHCPHSMWNTVYVMVGRLSHHFKAAVACSGFAAEWPACSI